MINSILPRRPSLTLPSHFLLTNIVSTIWPNLIRKAVTNDGIRKAVITLCANSSRSSSNNACQSWRTNDDTKSCFCRVKMFAFTLTYGNHNIQETRNTSGIVFFKITRVLVAIESSISGMGPTFRRDCTIFTRLPKTCFGFSLFAWLKSSSACFRISLVHLASASVSIRDLQTSTTIFCSNAEFRF